MIGFAGKGSSLRTRGCTWAILNVFGSLAVSGKKVAFEKHKAAFFKYMDLGLPASESSFKLQILGPQPRPKEPKSESVTQELSNKYPSEV